MVAYVVWYLAHANQLKQALVEGLPAAGIGTRASMEEGFYFAQWFAAGVTLVIWSAGSSLLGMLALLSRAERLYIEGP
jgi:hypothetical protein